MSAQSCALMPTRCKLVLLRWSHGKLSAAALFQCVASSRHHAQHKARGIRLASYSMHPPRVHAVKGPAFCNEGVMGSRGLQTVGMQRLLAAAITAVAALHLRCGRRRSNGSSIVVTGWYVRRAIVYWSLFLAASDGNRVGPIGRRRVAGGSRSELGPTFVRLHHATAVPLAIDEDNCVHKGGKGATLQQFGFVLVMQNSHRRVYFSVCGAIRQ